MLKAIISYEMHVKEYIRLNAEVLNSYEVQHTNKRTTGLHWMKTALKR